MMTQWDEIGNDWPSVLILLYCYFFRKDLDLMVWRT